MVVGEGGGDKRAGRRPALSWRENFERNGHVSINTNLGGYLFGELNE